VLPIRLADQPGQPALIAPALPPPPHTHTPQLPAPALLQHNQAAVAELFVEDAEVITAARAHQLLQVPLLMCMCKQGQCSLRGRECCLQPPRRWTRNESCCCCRRRCTPQRPP
jgi:hypothetical protein